MRIHVLNEIPSPAVHRCRAVTVAVLVLTSAVTAHAHDTWLVAAKSKAAVGETVRVALCTGEVFPTSDQSVEADRLARHTVAGGGGKSRIDRWVVEEKELAGYVTVQGPGDLVIAVQTKPKFIELSAAEFEEYLQDERATDALAAWRARADPVPHRSSDGPPSSGREMYTKHAKTFVDVDGPTKIPGYSTSLKMMQYILDLMPQSNPGQWKSGEEVTVQVLFEGRPASGFRVAGGHDGLPPHTYVVEAVTDTHGMAKFRFPRAGLWFLRTHTIRPIKPDMAETSGAEAATPEADWESFWASMTFRVGE